MADTLTTIRNVSLAGLAICFLVCVGGLILFQDDLSAALELNTAHGQFLATMEREEPGALVEVIDVSDRSAALVIGVPAPEIDAAEVMRLQDAAWVAYVDAFASGGFAISHVSVAALADDGTLGSERLGTVDIATLAGRTGRAAPALHSMYAANDYFDPATEVPPALDPEFAPAPSDN